MKEINEQEKLINMELTPMIEEDINDNVEEPEELSDEEKEKQRIEMIKSTHLRYSTNKEFGVNYRKKQASKRRETRKSRRANRKK